MKINLPPDFDGDLEHLEDIRRLQRERELLKSETDFVPNWATNWKEPK
jgi:hypothetical protein